MPSLEDGIFTFFGIVDLVRFEFAFVLGGGTRDEFGLQCYLCFSKSSVDEYLSRLLFDQDTLI